jgi:hypothetical protein
MKETVVALNFDIPNKQFFNLKVIKLAHKLKEPQLFCWKKLFKTLFTKSSSTKNCPMSDSHMTLSLITLWVVSLTNELKCSKKN